MKPYYQVQTPNHPTNELCQYTNFKDAERLARKLACMFDHAEIIGINGREKEIYYDYEDGKIIRTEM